MRPFSLFIAFFLLSFAIQAQQDTTKLWHSLFPRHNVQVSIGDPMFAQLLFSINSLNDKYIQQENWFSPDAYRGAKIVTFPFSVEYFYQIKKRFAVGIFGTYFGTFYNEYDRTNDNKVNQVRKHIIALHPVIRFSWLQKPKISLYSALSFGGLLYISQSYDKFNLDFMPTFQCTLLGITVGKKWYLLGEYGVGTKGIIVAGGGYRF